MYPVITVPDDAADSTEQLGTKEKFWFRDDSGQRYLFKQGRPGTGEDWAEKVSAELCERVGMPHAAYDLAQWRGQPGVVSRSFVPEDSQLVHGNELLAKLVKAYAETRYYHQTGHTIRRVFMSCATQLSKLLLLGLRTPTSTALRMSLWATSCSTS